MNTTIGVGGGVRFLPTPDIDFSQLRPLVIIAPRLIIIIVVVLIVVLMIIVPHLEDCSIV